MSASPPRRPPGPPPPRAPPTGVPSAPAAIQRPSGPPPSAPPPRLIAIKPPPMAPPPSNLQQTAQRPGVDGAKQLASDSKAALDNSALDSTAASKNAVSMVNAPSQAKAGAISMFEQPIAAPPVEPPPSASTLPVGSIPPRGPPMGPPRGPLPRGPQAQAPSADPSIPLMRAPRPGPPRQPPPGIPAGQPLPPSMRPPEDKKPPAPVRPAPLSPDGGRAPPKDDPAEELRKRRLEPVTAPNTEPPLLRIKKPKEEPFVKRRERDMPEFDSSDEDEEDPNFVKQPLPFGVIKGKIPPLKGEKEEEDELPVKGMLDTTVPLAANPKSDAASVAQSAVSVADTKRSDFQPSVATKPTDPPSVAPSENQMSAFVPSAPIAMDNFVDKSAIGKTLSCGRLSIRCIEGVDIRRKDDKDRVPRNDPFIKFRLGAAERHPWKSSQVKRKQNANPKFDDEIVFFDMTDPKQYVFNEDVQLCIELWNKSTSRNDLVGSVSMSVLRFFKQPFVSYTEKVPIYYPGASRTTMKLVLEIVFEEARSGLAQITFYEAKNLRSIDPMGQQDPFVQVSLGKHYKKRTPSVKNGGTNPYFNEQEVWMWLDSENWIEDLRVEVLDEDAKEDKPIGSTHFSLLPYMKLTPDASRENEYDLFYYVVVDPKDDSEKKEVPCGSIFMTVRFYIAGSLNVLVDKAKGLTLPEELSKVTKDRFDPYVQLTLDGKAVQMIKRTPADKDGGRDPSWNTTINFMIVDQYTLDLKVYNQSVVSGDSLIGFAEVSLLNAFRNGIHELWVTLKQRKANGGIREVGDIFLKMTFVGPVGIGYPQCRPEIDNYDDTLRKAPGISQEAKEEAKAVISTIPPENEDVAAEKQRIKDFEEQLLANRNVEQEFTDEEIIAAFKFIDLDHNNFVGAAEIRHILVCMGEMVTDEEIDMMISMVDLDGDGQVSFKEFRALVLHPNPGLVDMQKEINKVREDEVMKDKQALTGKANVLELSSFQRQKELLKREEKKKRLLTFIDDNEINFEYIRQSFGTFVELPKELRVGGRVKFPEFCTVMKVEPITEYKNLHAFYDDEEMGDMDMREFLLNLLNFVAVDKEERIRFSFDMFDESKTGFIGQLEVQEILRGNHMLTLASVERKAETIMKQANKNLEGAITLKEFLVISRKFPNIMFPTAGITTKK